MERIKNYINGEWVYSETKEYGDVWCPATGEKIAEFAAAVGLHGMFG